MSPAADWRTSGRSALAFVPLVCAAACAPASSGGVSAAAPDATTLALTHVNVVDVERGCVLRDQTVLVAGTRIRAVTPSDSSGAAATRRVADARGLYVIPGLWDMHAHVMGGFEQRAALLLANGITGIRQPGGGRLDSLRAVRARIARGGRPLPRLVAAGVLIDGYPPVLPGSAVVRRPEDAPRVVDSLVGSGVDFLKLYARLSRESFYALAAEAKRRKMPFVGHVPNALSPTEVSDAGMRSIEHMFEFPLACSSREDDMRRLRLETQGRAGGRAVRMAVSDTLLRTYDRAKCHAMSARLAGNGTWVTPTLHLARSLSRFGDPALLDRARLRYFPADAPSRIASARLNAEFAISPEFSRRLYALLAEIAGDMHRAGVPFLAGSDTPAPYQWTGFSLHDELRTLVEDAHLTPAEALRTATLNPARFLEATDSLGTVAPGKLADLVLLSAIPLDDIRNTERVAGVVVNGRYLDRAALDEMLAGVERRASASRE